MIGKNIAAAAHYLTEDQIIGLPTETVYGLAGNALSEQAVRKIFALKGRPSWHPLIVHVRDLAAALDLVDHMPESAMALAKAFWPGPLTLILRKNDRVPAAVTGGKNTVALRVPSHPMAQQLLHQLEFPLAAPSANLFGYVSPTTAAHVAAQLGDKLPYILDGGACPLGLESTIVNALTVPPTLYRLGALTEEKLTQVAGPLQVKTKQNRALPGMLKHHYAPHTPLYFGSLAALLEGGHPFDAALLCWRKVPVVKQFAHYRVLAPQTGSLEEAAHNLFGALRALDAVGAPFMLAAQLPEEGLGKAINQRLRKAACRCVLR